MKTLDVGCGYDFKGDVNVDLFFSKKIMHRQIEQKSYLAFKKSFFVEKIPNLVCADSNFLPFRKNVFEIVYCHHLLEHKGVFLIATTKELLRVCKRKLVITVPSQFSDSKYSQKHSSFLHDKIFTANTFHLLFRNFDRKVKYQRFNFCYVSFQNRILRFIIRHLPKWFIFFIPTEIRIEVNKNPI